MLGKLFNLGAGSADPSTPSPSSSNSSKLVLTLESVQEDMHTRSLLFPDPQTLARNRHEQLFPMPLPPTNHLPPFDYIPEISLEDRDIRVLIMQDALGTSVSASLLYDSQPAPTVVERPAIPDSWRSPGKTRRSSVPHTPAVAGARASVVDVPPPRSGTFDRRSSTNGRYPLSVETDAQKSGREYREEISTFMSCTFGNSEIFSYKGTSTKVHLVPTDPQTSEFGSSSILGDGRNSIGRSSMRSRLAQSYSSDLMSPGFPPNLSYTTTASTSTSMTGRTNDNKRVLITRLFPVPVPADLEPSSSLDNAPKKSQTRPKKTPMYAVVLVINLQALSGLTSRSGFRGANSFTENDSLPSSYGSGRKMAWNSGFGGPDLIEFAFNNSDERLKHITQHWDIIMRTLTHLQSIAATAIGFHLKQADAMMPEANNSSANASFRSVPPSLKANMKNVFVPANILAKSQLLVDEVSLCRERIASGLQAERVCTGQGRWSTWREEARLITRVPLKDGTPGRVFFYKALTGFLATHTQWLQVLGPEAYRQRHLEQDYLRAEEDVMNPARTIIVSQDKMEARRLLFLLSAFLPAHENYGSTSKSLRQSSSASFHYSASPPGFAIPTLGREQSLRKKMNKRPDNKGKLPTHHRTASQNIRMSLVPSTLAHLALGPNNHSRTDSGETSLRNPSELTTAVEIPRTSSAIASTAMPELAIAHITTLQRNDKFRSYRPGSSCSLAADDLKRSLHRSGSMSQGSDSVAGFRWGSIMSGFWGANPRRESLTSVTQSHMSSPVRGPPKDPISPKRSSEKRDRRDRQLDVMASLGFTSEELSTTVSEEAIANAEPSPEDTKMSTLATDQERNSGLQSAPDIQPRLPIDMPKPPHVFGSPIKTSINPEDGVIDVDIPFSDLVTPFETAVSSPSSSDYLSAAGIVTDGLTYFEQSARLSSDGDTPLNVAGWLKDFHPDFALQAIQPRDNLIQSIKAALRAEPTPKLLPCSPTAREPAYQWVQVSSALIIHMTKGTVNRLTYSRLISPAKDRSIRNIKSPNGPYNASSSLTPSVAPYEIWQDERFQVDKITYVEDILAEAVDRVLAQPGHDSLTRDSSTSDLSALPLPKSTVGSLRASSRLEAEMSSNLSSSMPPPSMLSNFIPLPGLRSSAPKESSPLQERLAQEDEVPRGKCKEVVLGALTRLIREVDDDRGIEDEDDSESVIRDAIRAWFREAE